MKNISSFGDRRDFLKTAAAITGGIAALSFLPAAHNSPAWPDSNYGEFAAVNPTAGDNGINIIGPKEGYSPQIGTLVSMMTWNRPPITNAVKGMTVEQLDFLLDAKANTIGALLYHLAATDVFYHEHTFKGMPWGKFDPAIMEKFDVAMNLGEPARQQIKGNSVDFYLNLLQETRENTFAEFKKRDDKWLMTVDDKWPWGPTNNYCKWFHVCEHESHHYGQIALLKSRVPGAKTGGNAG
jgi:Protein of unknown function (DUF664)